MALISLRAYARHRGCTIRAVQKAIESGRISTIDGRIDPVAADADWRRNTRIQLDPGQLAEIYSELAELRERVERLERAVAVDEDADD
jgi:hypothetical protein